MQDEWFQEKSVIGVSQALHLDSDFSFEIAHKEHIQVSFPIVGTFIPAAAKSKPFTGTVGVTAESVDEGASSPGGAGASHAMHFEADSEFVTMQSEHVHISFLGVGAFIPAAAKSNPCTAGVGLEPKENVEDPGGKGLGILGGLGLLALNLWRGGS